ncbi:MAG: hypothetical protein ABFR89_04625 [Actinomycetota bacterium]
MASQNDWDNWIELLRAHNPADPREIDPYSDTAYEILERATGGKIRQRSPRRLLVMAAAIAALLTAVAAAAILLTRDITNLTVVCYQAVDLSSDRAAVGSTGLPAAEDCEEVWRDGTLSIEGQTPGHVPPLIACVNDRGVLAVFPTDDPQTCEQLELASPDPSQPRNELEAIANVEQDLAIYLTSQSCQPLDEAEHVFRDTLDEHGLTDWTVHRQPDHPDRPCASVDYDIENKTLHLVPNIDPNS